MTTAKNDRAHQRLKTLFEGRVVVENRFSLISCTVRDLSNGGARIEFGGSYAPPPEFQLEIPSRDFSAWARTVWSSGRRHGVMFFKPSEAATMRPLSETRAVKLQEIIENARRAIADTIGVDVESVRLSLDLPEAEGEERATA
jgi:hypothetical protein